jgi:hypothetical protein
MALAISLIKESDTLVKANSDKKITISGTVYGLLIKFFIFS